MSVDTIIFPIKQPRMFNELIATANHFIVVSSSQTSTRASATTSHGCGHTQFIYICSCILGIDVDFSGKTKREIDDLMNYYSIKIDRVYQEIKNKFRNERNNNSILNNAVYSTILTKIDSIDDPRILINDIYNYGDWDVIPLCIFSDSPDDDELKYISHYFTLIINNKDNTCYINSSYGADNICELNTTRIINKEYFNDIISRINGGNFDENCDNFIRTYFLPNTSDELFQEQLTILRTSYIGFINNYVSNISSIVLNYPELTQDNLLKKRRRLGGKKTKHGKKTKQIKKYKTKNNKTKKYKTKKYKIKNRKTKRN